MNSQEGQSSQGDLLLVDDTSANLRLLSQVLQEAGYRVRAVTTGTRALAVAASAPPDLVLLDLRLPDIDGVNVCARLKADPLTAQIPVIFISAFDDAEAKVQAFASGGVDYVVKPINPSEVLARVATHLALRDLHRQLQNANRSLEHRLSELARINADLKHQINRRRAAEEAAADLLTLERKRVERLDALRSAMTALSGDLDLASVRVAVLTQTAALLDAPWVALAQAHPQTGELELLHEDVEEADASSVAPPWKQGLGASLFSTAAASRRLVRSHEHAGSNVQKDLVTALAVPLIAGDSLEAVLLVARPEYALPFGGDDEQILDLFAHQAATALQNARYFEEVRHLARTDPLTNLANRRHFFDLAQRELERVRRVQGMLAIVQLDIDYFKQVNDTHGHQAGDQVLQAVAELLRQGLRAADVSARYGGEELVIMLPDTDGVRAAAVAERVRSAVKSLQLASERGPISVSASFGVVAVDADELALSLDLILARADEACYEAKRLGRDRVVLWSAPRKDPAYDQLQR